MRGFDTKALILFPKFDTYENKSTAYKYELRRSVESLIKYLKSIDMEPHVFYTDDIARSLNLADVQYVSTLSRADRFFASKHCVGMTDAMSKQMIEYEDVYNEITAKDPGSLDMSEDERFELILRHNSKAASKIIPTYKVVIHFIARNKSQYKVTTKPNDGKIRINVSSNTFVPTVILSGNEENACDVLGTPYANRSLSLWEVVDVQ